MSTNNENQDANIEIPGVDCEQGIRNSGGPALYQIILGNVYNVIDSEGDLIEEYMNTEQIELFTLRVHSLKTTCRMIGATSLSEDFYTLEKLGDAKNLEEIKAFTPKVINKFKELKPHLEPYVEADDSVGGKEFNKDDALTLLGKLIDACNDFDADNCEKYIGEIEAYAWPNEYSEDIKKLSSLVNDFEYYDAGELAEKINSNLQ